MAFQFSQSGQRTQTDLPGLREKLFFPASSLKIAILLGSIVACMLSHRKASEGDAVRLLSDGSGGREERRQGGTWDLVGLIGWLPQQSPHYPAQIYLSPVWWGCGIT